MSLLTHKFTLSSINYRAVTARCAAVSKKIPWILARHAFLVVIAVVLVEILLGELLFYHYVVSVKKKEPEVFALPVSFQEDAYYSVVRALQERKMISEEGSSSVLQDPFF